MNKYRIEIKAGNDHESMYYDKWTLDKFATNKIRPMTQVKAIQVCQNQKKKYGRRGYIFRVVEYFQVEVYPRNRRK